jgi:2-phospho-L-lactate transferase/gluconeogenesis factor (CofD/UPF0052 family)
LTFAVLHAKVVLYPETERKEISMNTKPCPNNARHGERNAFNQRHVQEKAAETRRAIWEAGKSAMAAKHALEAVKRETSGDRK